MIQFVKNAILAAALAATAAWIAFDVMPSL